MNTETHFYFIRHGETDFNLRGMVQGRGVDSPLNDTGLAQASALAARFTTTPVDWIYSSPLTRALQTAQCVADACGITEIHTNPDLEEMSWGIYEGQQQSPELAAAFDEMRDRWHAGEYDFRVQGGESLREVRTRGLGAVTQLLQSHAGKRVLVVAHGRFLRIVLASLLAEFGLQRMEELRHSNTGVNHLVHDGKQFQAVVLDCTSHL